mmetsp:Transcript_49442/g.107679  ORF Transcript_49442/g.107679 Transcript_49442/m.107679 type:complete len:302 (-) Transcript_49442:43-948(-)
MPDRRSSCPRASVRRYGVATVLLGALAARCLAFSAWGVPAQSRSGALTARRSQLSSIEVKGEVRGEEGTSSYRRFYIGKDGQEISPWHDLPLSAEAEGEYWMVTEIPKMTKPKMEISTKEAGNPIAQDSKKGKLRDYHGPIFWNYGCLPQTWEDPTVEHPTLKVLGDNDPVDVVEIGSRTHEQGEVLRVKVLGVLAMIDDGELDWKVLAIASDDPMASELNDVADVEERMPEVLSGIREWFRWYKTPDGKPLNAFGFEEAFLDRGEAISVIEETHDAWKRLRAGKTSEGKLWTGASLSPGR